MKLSFKIEELKFDQVEINGIEIDLDGTPKETAKAFSIIMEMASDLAEEQALKASKEKDATPALESFESKKGFAAKAK